jgi:hypothetical protein
MPTAIIDPDLIHFFPGICLQKSAGGGNQGAITASPTKGRVAG